MSYWSDGEGRTVGVLGLGKSGRAAARLLSGRGFAVIGMDSDPSCGGCDHCGEVLVGEQQAKALGELDGLILSPGVDPSSEIPSAAEDKGIPVIGEIELAGLFATAPVLAVTGSNGKTTTVKWLGFTLGRAGYRPCVTGNMGYPFSLAVLENPDVDFYVVEVSSYQLQTIESFRARAAAILNVTPDHLTRHGSMEEYIRAKSRVFMNQTPDDSLVLNADDPMSVNFMGLTEGLELQFSLRREVRTGAFVENGSILLSWNGTRERVMGAEELALPGRHNLANALAVVCMARAVGLSADRMVPGLRDFQGVPHRLEEIRSLDGVLYVNDSKSTNIDSLRVALEAQSRPVVLIAGGRAKRGDYSQLADLVGSRVKLAVLMGEGARILKEAWERVTSVRTTERLDGALKAARKAAKPGDVVLLSPGCASFDQYRDFEERGEHFRTLVEELS
jgi:UDP-N-acetylmuramoylalanine--D-glutamate ligase